MARKKITKSAVKTKSPALGLGIVLGLAVLAFLSLWLAGCNKKVVRSASVPADPAKDFNVVVPVTHNTGNLNAVPKQELDSLFDGIKK